MLNLQLAAYVWYRGKDNAVRAAIVTHVWSQFLINLQAFGKDQNDTEAGIHTSVTHGDIEHEPSCCTIVELDAISKRSSR